MLGKNVKDFKAPGVIEGVRKWLLSYSLGECEFEWPSWTVKIA